jgi:hypothetical protein
MPDGSDYGVQIKKPEKDGINSIIPFAIYLTVIYNRNVFTTTGQLVVNEF